MRRRCGGWGGWRCGGGAEAELSRCSGTAVVRWCGARQCNAEAVCGGSAVWCAQQQPIALNPGVDGADLADLKAHNVTSEDQRSAGRRWVACRWPRQCAPAQTCRGGRAREIPFRGNLKGKLSVFQLDVFTLECGATHKSAPPAWTLLTHTWFQCSCTVARQGQRAAQLSVCLHHLAGVGINALAGHQASRRVGAVRSAEEQDVRLRPGGGRCGASSERVCDQMAHATRER